MTAELDPDDQQPELPCHVSDPDLWFADSPSDLERAKQLCAHCPIRRACLAEALDRGEPWGVWGGEILDRGAIVSFKRPRGRPRKIAA
ncbi:MAG TPA: WhiB family transcriptional regulator [Mycobacterium sp.]|jgi:WhiB family redox-sensing transcriptional regulator|nr:WhiB family transcriptional regulator [Mycobacterium sp.]